MSEQDIKAIKATTDTFVKAALASDWAGVAATYTEDAILMPPNHPAVTGRAGIETHFGGFPPLSDFALTDLEIEGCRDLAYVKGTFSLTMTPEGADPVEDSGNFLEIRKKLEDGSWLLYRDMYNSSVVMEH